MKIKSIISLCILSGVSLALAQPSHEYEIDPVHSGVNFKVRHFFNKVPGQFTKFSGKIDFNPSDPTKSTVRATIEPKSVDTSNSKRDSHLMGEEYFHTAKHEEITFQSTQWEPDGKTEDGHDKYKVTGDLSMLGQTRPVTLDVVYLGEMEGQGPYEGVMIAGWEASGEINRTDWGLEGGKPIVGDEVEIDLSIQGHRSAKTMPDTGGAGGK